MSFEQLYAPSLKELFVQKLQGMILSGELAMGEKLPSERELCQQRGVSRAVVNGGISELARQGKAAILIPSPNVTDDQQTKNAKALADIGGACMIREPELVNGKICKEVASLLEDGARRAAMEKAIAGFAPLDSNKLIFDELIRLSKSKK